VPVTRAGSLTLADDGTIYVPGQELGRDKDGRFMFNLRALDKKGVSKWTLGVDGQIEGGAAIAPDGTIYFGTNLTINPGPKPYLGILYALAEKNGGLMRAGWPKSFGSTTNDGRAPSGP